MTINVNNLGELRSAAKLLLQEFGNDRIFLFYGHNIELNDNL